jgi:hypothetical protein
VKVTTHLRPELVTALKTWAAEEGCAATDILERLVERERREKSEKSPKNNEK